MNEENKELLFDLLAKKAIYGVDESEEVQIDQMGGRDAEIEFRSLEITAAAISLVGISTDEPLPAHLYSKIVADADKFVVAGETEAAVPWPPYTPRYQNTDSREKRSGSWFGWVGWVAAAAACIALAVNMWFTRLQPVEIVTAPPVPTLQIKTPAEMRDEMMRATSGVIKANWAAGNVKEMKQVSGDVVWSDEKQTGYMRFRGLPVNDGTKETYQLWIFDKTQDKATPIDGGTFDVSADGDVVIPINAKLKAEGAEMFAITVERPGGVVVSKREKIAAIAKVETPVTPAA